MDQDWTGTVQSAEIQGTETIMGVTFRESQAGSRPGRERAGWASVDGLPEGENGCGTGAGAGVRLGRPRQSICEKVDRVGEPGAGLGGASDREWLEASGGWLLNQRATTHWPGGELWERKGLQAGSNRGRGATQRRF